MMFASAIPATIARRRAERAAAMLARDPRVCLVCLFGSAAERAGGMVHDVDLGILMDTAVPLREWLELRADLVTSVGEGLDLVLLNHASVVLAWEVANRGRCLYARTPEDEIDFITRARLRSSTPMS